MQVFRTQPAVGVTQTQEMGTDALGAGLTGPGQRFINIFAADLFNGQNIPDVTPPADGNYHLDLWPIKDGLVNVGLL